MNDAERLAIAEWMLNERSPGLDVRSRYQEFVLWKPASEKTWTVYRGSDWNMDVLAKGDDPIRCVAEARQKLREEREAKKSEREKRLEKLAKRVVKEMSNVGWAVQAELVKDATEALKESP